MNTSASRAVLGRDDPLLRRARFRRRAWSTELVIIRSVNDVGGAHRETVTIVAEADGENIARLRMLAEQLGLPCVANAAGIATPLVMLMDCGRLIVRAAGADAGGLAVDFSAIDVRTAPGGGGLSRKQPLAKAIGRETRAVVDATAGLGRDAFILACLGYDMTAIERSSIVYALLEDGLRRAEADPRLAGAMGGRLKLLHGEAREMLPELTRPDVVYLDPMFPPKRKKSALAKLDVRLLREIVGDDPDSEELFAVARRIALRRVVVKRSDDAPPMVATPEPTMRFGSKLVRYDVYAVA